MVSPIDLVLSLAAASGPRVVEESLVVTLDGVPVAVDEIPEDHGTRLHAAQGVAAGRVVIDYGASLDSLAPVAATRPADLVRYRRPSRYCESDRLAAVARSEFVGLAGHDLLAGVSSWVGTRLGYVAGAGLLLQFGLTPTGLAAIIALQPVLTAAPLNMGTIVGLLIFSVVCFATLAFFVRGAIRPQRPASPPSAGAHG